MLNFIWVKLQREEHEGFGDFSAIELYIQTGAILLHTYVCLLQLKLTEWSSKKYKNNSEQSGQINASQVVTNGI